MVRLTMAGMVLIEDELFARKSFNPCHHKGGKSSVWHEQSLTQSYLLTLHHEDVQQRSDNAYIRQNIS